MFLHLKELTKSFGKNIAVNNFNLKVDKGELISILGPSGCGKTTTLKMVGGFTKVDRGKVILDGKNINKYSPDQRPTSTVFQSYALFPHMNVLENVTYGLKFKNIGKKDRKYKGKEVLELVGLKNYDLKKINKLSGGEQQRVALARALIMNPKVLLLDEPLSNLDAKLRIKMRKEIKEIQSELGITTLYVTHDQEEALSMADRIVVMKNGEIRQVDIPENIYNSPAEKFVADFIGRANFIELDDKKIFVRPENIKLSKNKGKYEAIVKQKHFMGAYTTYFLLFNDRYIQVDYFGKNENTIVIGEKVYLDFNKIKELD